EQVPRGLTDAIAVVGPDRQGRRARPDREVGIAQLRRHGPRHLAAVPEMLRQARRLPPQLVMETLAVADVLCERLLVRDRDPLDRDLEAARVDTPGAVSQLPPDDAADELAELVVAERREVADRLDSRRDEALFRPRADARQQPDRERREKLGLPAGTHDRQPARLATVGGDLRHDLRGRDAERAGEVRSRPHDGADALRDRARVVEVGSDLLEVEISLVDAHLLDGRDDLAHERPDLA